MQRLIDSWSQWHWFHWITLGAVVVGPPVGFLMNLALGRPWREALLSKMVFSGFWGIAWVVFMVYRRWRQVAMISLLGLCLIGSIGCAALLIPGAIGVGVGAGLEADAVMDHMKKDRPAKAEAQP
jgi:hypothetical protein